MRATYEYGGLVSGGDSPPVPSPATEDVEVREPVAHGYGSTTGGEGATEHSGCSAPASDSVVLLPVPLLVAT